MPIEIERPKFLVDLLAEVDSFDEALFPANHELESSDKEIGVASVWTRKVFALMRFYSRELNRMKVEMEFESSEGKRLASSYRMLDYRVDTLKEILWSSVRQEFGAWDAESVAFRKDWKVVTTKLDPSEGFKKFLGGIIGQLE